MLYAVIFLCTTSAHAEFTINGVSSDGKVLKAYDETSISRVNKDVIHYQESDVFEEDSSETSHIRQIIADVEVDCSDLTYRTIKTKTIMYNGKKVVRKVNCIKKQYESGTLGFSAAARVCSRAATQ